MTVDSSQVTPVASSSEQTASFMSQITTSGDQAQQNSAALVRAGFATRVTADNTAKGTNTAPHACSAHATQSQLWHPHECLSRCVALNKGLALRCSALKQVAQQPGASPTHSEGHCRTVRVRRSCQTVGVDALTTCH